MLRQHRQHRIRQAAADGIKYPIGVLTHLLQHQPVGLQDRINALLRQTVNMPLRTDHPAH